MITSSFELPGCLLCYKVSDGRAGLVTLAHSISALA